MKLRISLGLILALVAGSQASASIINAVTAALTDVQSAITKAAAGDTVVVSPGGVSVAMNWTSGLTLSKPITIDLTGVTLTRSSGSTIFFYYTAPSTAPATGLRITGGTFIETTGDKFIKMDGTAASFAFPKFRIDHCSFTSSAQAIFIEIYSNFGLIDHCTFKGNDASEMIHNTAYADKVTTGWTQDIVPGGPDAVYIEDCTFSKYDITSSSFVGTSAIEAYDGARTVFRHNTCIYCQVDQHGTAGNVGARWYEIYNNVFVIPGPNNGGGSGSHNQSNVMDIRAGSGVIFNNSMDPNGGANAGGGFLTLREEDTGQTAGDPAYPFLYQIGRGKNQTSDPLYLWNNVVKNFGSSSTSVTEGTDFISTNPSGRPGYTPYTYPHPMTNPGPPNTATVHMATSQ